MKAIMISIKPKWVAKILNGEKTIEIRKTMPKCDLPIDVYVYCTKEDSLSLLKTYPKDTYVCEQEFKCNDFPYLCSGYEGKGKVVAKFTLNKVEEIVRYDGEFYTPTYEENKICQNACLSWEEIHRYLANKKTGYAWHIDDLEIFGKPKELNEFNKWNNPRFPYFLTKAPQSWCYVEVLL